MGWNDHLLDDDECQYEYTCKCGAKFIVTEKDQTPGFRETEELICPKCRTVISKSREVEFSTRLIN